MLSLFQALLSRLVSGCVDCFVKVFAGFVVCFVCVMRVVRFPKVNFDVMISKHTLYLSHVSG